MDVPENYREIPIGLPFVITNSEDPRTEDLVGVVASLERADSSGVYLSMPREDDLAYWYWSEVELADSGIAALYGYDVKDMTP